jgi:hypothetical protein
VVEATSLVIRSPPAPTPQPDPSPPPVRPQPSTCGVAFTLRGLKGKVVLRPGRFVRMMMPSGAFGGLRAITNGHGADICYHVKSDRLIYPNGNPVDALDLVKNVT